MLLDLAQKKGRKFEASAGYRRRDRLQSNSCRTDRCQVRERERSALFFV
jgi:hypothetical protein